MSEIQVEAKKVSIKFVGSALKLLVDSNLDGEPVLDLTVNLGEAADEIADAFFNKEEK